MEGLNRDLLARGVSTPTPPAPWVPPPGFTPITTPMGGIELPSQRRARLERAAREAVKKAHLSKNEAPH